MRKTLIALIIVLPLLFVLVIFSSLNIISLSVNIAVNGIKIITERGEEQLLLDIAEYSGVKLSAEISPSNATDKRYALKSDAPDIVDVEEDGTLTPLKEGSANIIATSNDMGFTDSIPVTVTSSKPYEFEFKLYDSNKNNVLRATNAGYSARSLPAGEYTYEMNISPVGFDEYDLKIKSEDSYAVINKGAGTIMLPFSGNIDLEVSVPNGATGDLSKRIELGVKKPSRNDIVVNGSVDNAVINITKGVKSTSIYVECSQEPTFISQYAKGEVRSLQNGRYIIDITINDDIGEDQNVIDDVQIISGTNSANVEFTYQDFGFLINSTRKIDRDTMTTYVLTHMRNTFYAVSTAHVSGVEYTWTVDGADQSVLTTADDGATCYIDPIEKGKFNVTIEAKIDGATVDTKTMTVEVYNRVISAIVTNKFKEQGSLEETYTIAGKKFAQNLEIGEDVRYGLDVLTYIPDPNQPNGYAPAAGDETLEYILSDDSLATIEMEDGKAYLTPKGNGNLSVNIRWKGNDLFDASVSININVNVVADAVEVTNDPELRKAMELKKKAVLTTNIKMGTHADGSDYSIEERKALLAGNRTMSTYNIEYYKMIGRGNDAKISYVLEFTADVYGNGHNIDADNFTHCLESSGEHKPILELYSGPLYFVNATNDLAHVSGQDNCAYLIRTDGIKLYGLNLLGCSDESIVDRNSGEGSADLNNLNLTGTTLEINASCDIVNCRIRNGRNVVRVYGGNKNGNNYAVTGLGQVDADSERITVNIEGCIISHGREFLVKVGTNHALKSTGQSNTEPKFTDANGRPYSVGKSNYYADLYKDAYFYDNYVLTDLTLADSVLEQSGLFSIGVESNFAGPMLARDFGNNDSSEQAYASVSPAWRNSGGTSYAAVLRLKGDVRLYDWKNLVLVDSSTLIEGDALKDWMKLDLNKMLEYVTHENEEYGALFRTMPGIDVDKDGKDDNYVHGGIAFYGGGVNYSQLDISEMSSALSDFTHVNINISILGNAPDSKLQSQGRLLPKAAGSNDFNFFMYSNTSPNNYEKQIADKDTGDRYKGVTPKPLF